MGYSQLQQKSGFVLLPGNAQGSTTSYKTLVDKNGLIQVVANKSSQKSIGRLAGPFKLVILFVLLVTVFKALALINVGTVDYETELDTLKGGNIVEQAGAFVLQIDPLTSVLFKNVGPFLK